MSFRRYARYKVSGVAWLGAVPDHWTVLRFQRCVDVAEGQVDPEDADFARMPLIAPNHIESATGRLIGLESATEQGAASGKYLCKAGDVVYSKIRPALRKVCIAPEDCLCSADMYPLRPHSGLTNAFLFWLILSEEFSSLAVLESDRVAMPKINRESLKAVAIAVPPTHEQDFISEFLDRETAKTDALVAEQRRLIELLKEKRQAVISHAVTKGLNPDAPMKPSGIEWLGDVPEHWSVKRLKHISPFMTVGIVVNPSTFVAEEGFPFIYGGDIREGVIDWKNARCIDTESSDSNAKTRLKAGDLLTVRVGAPGVTAVVPVECEGGNCASVMLIRQGNFNSQWLCYAMNTRIVRFQVEVVQYGAAQEQFNISHAVKFWTPTPPRAEQDEIAHFVELETSRFDELTAEAQQAIDLLQERRTALISTAVTGKIDVRGLAEADAA
jgi:type I restriction enzyme, S subunit